MLVEEHVAGSAVTFTHPAALVIVAETLLFEFSKVEVADSRIVKLHPWVLLSAYPVCVVLFLVHTTVGVDVGPVVASLSVAVMYIAANKLVLVAVVDLRLSSLLDLFLLGLELSCRHLAQFFLFLLLLLRCLQAAFFAHHCVIRVRL